MAALLPARFAAFASLRSLLLPVLPAAPLSITLHFPAILPGMWDSVLRAVPKKKQSHSRKRMRQLAGKALQDITSLSKCSSCGATKRSHVLCKHCVRDIQSMWLGKEKKEHPESATQM